MANGTATPGVDPSGTGGFGFNLLPGLYAQANPVNTTQSNPMVANGVIPGGSGDIVANLPALRATSGGGTSQIDPTLIPYLQMGLQRAEQLFFGQPQPSMYPEQMYVSPSQQTLEALAAQENIARQGMAPLTAGQQAYAQSLGQIGQTAAGGFLQGSPYQQAAIQAATRPLQQQFTESTLPAIQSAFSRAGRYGSGAQERAIAQAQEATSRAMGDVTANIAYQDYARERGLQQQAIAQQAALGAMAPQFYQAQMLPAQTLAQVGQQQEAIAAQPLQEAIQRYQFGQQLPYNQLQGYLSSVYGTPLSQSIYAPTPQYQNTMMNTVAGAGLGYVGGQALGSFLGGTPFSLTSPSGYGLTGAGIGGLLGGGFF
jgi:hypothetical protein